MAIGAGVLGVVVAAAALVFALKGSGDSGASNRELVGVPLSVPAGETKTLTARCPEGKFALGGGFETHDAQLDVLASTPFFAGNGWRLVARSRADTSAVVFINVVCAAA